MRNKSNKIKREQRGVKRFFRNLDYRDFFYGMFSNWGIVVVSNILGLAFIDLIGIDLVKMFHPFAYLILSVALYFPALRLRDFRLGYLIGFLIGLIFLFKFYYPLFFGA